MNILFIARHKFPHVGGVEKHVDMVSASLIKKGHKVRIISEEDIKFPHIKVFGLLFIWFWFLKNLNLIISSDVVHIHDVFIWFFPFRFLFPFKKIYLTHHGWEGVFPIPLFNILMKRISTLLSNGTICIGGYIEKYYGIKADKIIYGGIEKHKTAKKNKGTILFLGRLEKDTGLLQFLSWLKKHNKYSVSFAGDGSLRNECRKFGRVLGFINPGKLLSKSAFCVPGGYLSYIEAVSYGCRVITFSDNPLKKDYWDEIRKVKSFPSWDNVAYEYLSLYNNLK